MSATLKKQHSRIGTQSASHIVLIQTIPAWCYWVMVAALVLCGCTSEHSTIASLAHSDDYRHELAVSDVHSFLYLEPGAQTQVPQVRGSIRNLGNETLIMVEVTLAFKDRRNKVIFEETAYPIYVSSLSHAQGSKSLAPGQQVKFAFRSPACPKTWEPGQVDVRVTKVVASNS
jgi:hypothetical protein